MKAISKAIQIAGAKVIASECGDISVQAVHKWSASSVPAAHCPSIERATKGAVRCEDLRPDVDWAYLRGTKKRAA